jgi:serine/threonine protein kinase
MNFTLDLLSDMLTYDPKKRITASQALQHKWFETSPFPCPNYDLPKLNHEYHIKIP